MRQVSLALAVIGGILFTFTFGFVALIGFAYSGLDYALPLMVIVFLVDALIVLQHKNRKFAFATIIVVIVYMVYLQVEHDLIWSLSVMDSITLRIVSSFLFIVTSSVMYLFEKKINLSK